MVLFSPLSFESNNSYAKPQILKNYILLAADFEKNSAHTNHCIAKMLHRIGFELGYIGMLFQASLFRIFQRIMHGPAAQTAAFQVNSLAGQFKQVICRMYFWPREKILFIFSCSYILLSFTLCSPSPLLTYYKNYSSISQFTKLSWISQMNFDKEKITLCEFWNTREVDKNIFGFLQIEMFLSLLS